jgi:hypothetical protein
MSKTQQVHQNQHTDQSHQATSVHHSEGLESNANELAQVGVDGGGADVGEMDLTGSFAGMVLDCMPMIAAFPMAQRFASNPAVLEWAAQYTVEDLVSAVGGASTALLKQLWPVGIGFDAEGQVAGRFAGGVDVMAQTSAIRTGPNRLDVGIGYQASVGVEGVGAGVEMTDAFGEKAAGVMAKAGIKVAASVQANQTTEFDAMEVLRASKNLAEQSVSDILVHPLAPMQFLLPDEWIGRIDYMCIDDWKIVREIVLSGGASATEGQLDPSKHSGLVGDLMAFDPLGVRAENIMPFLDGSICSELAVRFEGNDRMLMEGALKTVGSVEGIANLPGMAEVLSPESLSVLSEIVAGGAEAGIVLSLDLTVPNWKESIDMELSGIQTVTNTDLEGVSIEDSVFISMASLSTELRSSAPDGSTEVVVCPTLARTVHIDLDPSQADAHCPELLQQVLGITGTLYDSQTVLQLTGTMELGSDVANPLIAQMFSGPNRLTGVSIAEIFDAAMARASGTVDVWPGWAQGWEVVLEQLVGVIAFSGARIVGHVHQGAGGGFEVSLAASAEAVARMEGGIVVDRPVSGEDAMRIRAAMSGNLNAA